MTRRQLAYMYGAILFAIIWGIDLVNAIKFSKAVRLIDAFNLFNLSQLVYACGTMLGTHLLLRRYNKPGSRWKLLPAYVAVVTAFVLFRYGVEESLFPWLTGWRNYNPNTPFVFYFLDNIYYASVYVIFGSLIYFADESMRSRRRTQELQEQNREAELAFLRAQVNPHFLFNSLNNIYALSYKGSPKAPDAILRLSELMRYMLYEKKDRLPLETEWSYVQHFIELQQLRYERPLAIGLSCTGPVDQWQIPPYLLLPFIENAFKHGDASRPFSFELSCDATALRFTAVNAVGKQQKDAGGGIGLENVRRRLELLYPGHHQMTVLVEDDQFRVQLELLQTGTPGIQYISTEKRTSNAPAHRNTGR